MKTIINENGKPEGNNKTYTFYSDPSHGWLEVQRKELKELNILNNVSEWSYIKGEFVYLEEDCDANIFINAFKSKFGVNPKIYEPIEDNYEIRSYRRFKKGKNENNN